MCRPVAPAGPQATHSMSCAREHGHRGAAAGSRQQGVPGAKGRQHVWEESGGVLSRQGAGGGGHIPLGHIARQQFSGRSAPRVGVDLH